MTFSMEPSITECTDFNNIGDVLVWAGFSGTDASKDTARGALLLAFDVTAEDHPRIVGNLTEADLRGGAGRREGRGQPLP